MEFMFKFPLFLTRNTKSNSWNWQGCSVFLHCASVVLESTVNGLLTNSPAALQSLLSVTQPAPCVPGCARLSLRENLLSVTSSVTTESEAMSASGLNYSHQLNHSDHLQSGFLSRRRSRLVTELASLVIFQIAKVCTQCRV